MAKKRPRRQRMTRIEALKRKLRSDKFFAGKEFVVQPSGKEKMSEVVLEFIEPYQELATTYEAYNQLIAVAILVWNVALIPKERRQRVLDDAIKAVLLPSDKANRQIFLEIVDELIRRKERHFPENKRFIMSYQLSESKNDYHLSVASTL